MFILISPSHGSLFMLTTVLLPSTGFSCGSQEPSPFRPALFIVKGPQNDVPLQRNTCLYDKNSESVITFCLCKGVLKGLTLLNLHDSPHYDFCYKWSLEVCLPRGSPGDDNNYCYSIQFNSQIIHIALPYRKSIMGGLCTALAKLKTG